MHPSHNIGFQFPSCKMVITNDHAWLSTLSTFNEEISIERVLASHDVRIENGQHFTYYLISMCHKSHYPLKVFCVWIEKM
jgi:hypothetical protein